MNWIFHIAERSAWEQGLATGKYAAPSLANEGFIHCSTRSQVIETANRYYRGRSGLVLLCVEPSLLGAALIYEAAAPPAGTDEPMRVRQELFPHVYAAIDVAAIAQVVAFEPSANGEFAWPAESGRGW